MEALSLPSWSAERRQLPDAMLEYLGSGIFACLVRDGISIGVVLQNRGTVSGFPKQIRRFGLRLIWSDTPHGAVVGAYALIEPSPGDVRKMEGFLSPYQRSAAPHPQTDHWLLRRLTRSSGGFVVFADGPQVLHNHRCKFSPAGRREHDAIYAKLVKMETRDSSADQAARDWYTRNSDFNSIGFI